MREFKDIINTDNITFLSPWPGGARFYWKYNDLDFLVLATDNDEDHVSISHSDRSIKPTLEQMIELKNIFFKPYECAHIYMKQDGKKLLVSNCYHIYRKHNEIA
ncbi:DUF7694 domain-containing protein [Enterococcus hermanniensis]|nr:hypothetical protein [Enterococcus hermanniensis]